MTDIEWAIAIFIVLCMCGIAWKMTADADARQLARWKNAYNARSEIDQDALRARLLMAQIVSAKRMKKRRSHLQAELDTIRERQDARASGGNLKA